MATDLHLGDALVTRGVLSPTELAQALRYQRASGDRLGRILLTLGFLDRATLAQALGELWGIGSVRLEWGIVDPEVARLLPDGDQLYHRAIPIRRVDDRLEVATANPPSTELAAVLRQYAGHCEIRWFATTDWDIDQAIASLTGALASDPRGSQLYYRSTEESIGRLVTLPQLLVIGLLVAPALWLWWIRPWWAVQVMTAAAALFVLAVTGYRAVAALAGRHCRILRTEDQIADAIPDGDLPRYTVLVPVFRTDADVEGVVRHLRAMDYPADQLEILLLVDEDRLDDLRHVVRGPRDIVRLLAVPPRYPRTKARRCNVGLLYARGDFVVVYDVEDRPDLRQLRRAWMAHRRAGPGTLAAIASLVFPAGDTTLARLTAREDTVWFRALLPGLLRLGQPVPLPGSSCHFRTAPLRRLGGWDPFHAAADADLGLRAAEADLGVIVFDGETMQPVEGRLFRWLAQRTRWLRGGIQSGLMHTRRGRRGSRAERIRHFAAVLLFVLGTPLAFGLVPFALVGTILGVVFHGTGLLVGLAAGALAAAAVLSTLVLAMPMANAPRVGLRVVLLPVYWILHTPAAIAAWYYVFARTMPAVARRSLVRSAPAAGTTAVAAMVVMGALLVPATALAQDTTVHRPRAREIGVAPGIFAPGPQNAITDVAGVQVGHATRIAGDSIRTGITAILPHGGNLFRERVPAAVVVGNGFGKLLGSTQVDELGELETPILLTCTLCVWRAADALVAWMLEQPGMETVRSINPLVAETNDGGLNAIRQRPIGVEAVREALAAARDGPVAEGSVGAGTGTIAFGWKGGIGTSSRVLPERLGGWTVGVLVQTNFGGVLQVLGAPVGRKLGRFAFQGALDRDGGDGSIVIVVATDAPIGERNLRRLAARALFGLARTGSSASNGSGDYVIAFSTAPSLRRAPGAPADAAERVGNDGMSGLFQGVAEATEEAIYNSLFRATTVTSRYGTADAIPIDRVVEILRNSGIPASRPR